MAELDWSRISPVLDELFELGPAERARRLAGIEAGDPALAARLRRLLAADEASGILDRGIAEASPTLGREIADNADRGGAARRAAGARLGPYLLVERIGAGGMGEVWRGERVDDFEQQVAIKLVRPLLDSPALRERFMRERRILARLDHPNIARLLDGGVSEDGTPWYAMEFVRGRDLVSWCDAQRLDARDRVRLLLQVCEAVAHAQALLVIHRDLKPSNILVDEAGRVRVLDFGIARLLDDTDEARLTATGVRVYSPAYAAPEQIRGDPVGTAADVFALGAVLYELLTGSLPYPQRGASPDRLLAALAQESAPRPSQALRTHPGAEIESRWTGLTRDNRTDLDLIVATALHPDPTRRYAGTAQLGDDLRRWLEGRPITARADTAGYRMRSFVARHRLVVASASAVLVALVAGLAVALWQMGVAREEARRADAEARDLERTYRFVVSLFSSIDPTRGGGSDQQRTLETLVRSGLARLDEELPDQPDVRAGLRAMWSNLLISHGHIEDGLPLLERAVAELASHSPALDNDLLASLINLAGAYKNAGRSGPAEDTARRALRLVDTLPGDQRHQRIQVRTILANLATVQHRAHEAIELHEQILADRRALPGIRPADLAVNYNNLASAYLIADRYVEAERRYRELDQLLRETPDTPPSRRVYSLSGIAWALVGQGREQEALALIDEAEAIGRESLSAEHVVVVNAQVLRGRAAMARGAQAEADALFAAALPRLPGSAGALGLAHWGVGLIDQGRHAEARTRLLDALERLTEVGSSEAPTGYLVQALLAIAEAHADPSALPAAEAAVTHFEALSLTGFDEYPRAALALADLLDAHGKPDAASEWRRKAERAAAPLLGEQHPLTLRARSAGSAG